MHSAEMVFEVVCAVFLAEGISDSPTLQNQCHQDQGGGECDAPFQKEQPRLYKPR
jgi:hypothetical protein